MTGLRSFIAAAAALAAAPALAQPAAPAGQVEHGRAVFQYWCSNCHGTGSGKPGTVALAAKYKGAKPALLEERTDLPAPLTKFFVRNGVSIMPFFRKTEIGDPDLDALAAYLARNTR